MRLFLVFLLAVVLLGADIDAVLDKIERTSDLSHITREKNSGIAYIFTRRDLEMMNAKHIRDVLKHTPVGFRINRYGGVDPLSPSSFIPFGTSTIKLYIDNHELTSGLYNSGLGVLGDLSIEFVDHIEVYIFNPRLSTIQEPAFVVIKLFSKDPKREQDVTLQGARSSYDSWYANGDFAISDSLYLNADFEDEKKGVPHSNRRLAQFLGSYVKDEYSFDLFYLKNDMDGFLGPSLDGAPQESKNKEDYLFAGYRYDDGVDRFAFSFSRFKDKVSYQERPILFYLGSMPISSTDVASSDYVVDVSYMHTFRFDAAGHHELSVGAKWRNKHFRFDRLRIDNFDYPTSGHTFQQIGTLFFQYDYAPQENLILNAGISKQKVRNNGGVGSYRPTLYRLGATYTHQGGYGVQLQFSHFDYYVDPYLINSIYVAKPLLDMEEIDNFLFRFFKTSSCFEGSVTFGIFQGYNYFLPNEQGLLDNYKAWLREKYFDINFKYYYAPFCALEGGLYIQQIHNLPKISTIRLSQFELRNLHEWGRWSFYEGVVYNDKRSYVDSSGWDVDVGVRYHINDDMSFFIKGENIFDSAVEESYPLFDPATMRPIGRYEVPSVERRWWFGIEWSF